LLVDATKEKVFSKSFKDVAVLSRASASNEKRPAAVEQLVEHSTTNNEIEGLKTAAMSSRKRKRWRERKSRKREAE
jgi:hypothetical protein